MTSSSETCNQSTHGWPWMSLGYAQAWAKTLNNQTGFYGYKGVYGALDGLANAYGLSKFYFDVTYSTSSQAEAFDAMHNWIISPAGFVTILVDSAILMAFSAMGNVYKEDDPDHLKAQIYVAWKIFRELAQASKNALKAVRGAWMTVALFIPHDVHRLILPSGIVLGGAYALSRYLFLGINKQRDDMTASNTKLLKSIRTYGTLHRSTREDEPFENMTKYANNYVLWSPKGDGVSQLYFIDKHGQIDKDEQRKHNPLYVTDNGINFLLKRLDQQSATHLSMFQWSELIDPSLVHKHYSTFKSDIKTVDRELTNWQTTKHLFLKAYNGLIDSLYLLLGVVTLAPLSGLALPLATFCSLMYCVLCIATRIYEERELQHQLSMSVKHINLTLCAKDLESTLILLNSIQKAIPDLHRTQTIIKHQETEANTELDRLQTQFEELSDKRFEANKVLLVSRILLGSKHGIAAYGAVLSALFAFTTLGALVGVSLSPGLVLGCIVAGIPIILACILNATIIHEKANTNKQPDTENSLRNKLIDRIKRNRISIDEGSSDKIQLNRLLLTDNLSIEPQFYLTETFEVVRSFFSGLLKGKKEVEFLLSPLQKPDACGHFQDTSVMLPFIALSGLLYSSVFALKAFAKGFKPENNRSAHLASQDDYKVSPSFVTRSSLANASMFSSSLPRNRGCGDLSSSTHTNDLVCAVQGECVQTPRRVRSASL